MPRQRTTSTTAPDDAPRDAQPSRVSGHTTDGYPSWLPRRPPHPEPASTLPSMRVLDSPEGEPIPDTPTFAPGGRKPTPRSVRVVRMHGDATPEPADSFARRVPTDATRVNHPVQTRVWSRATTAGLTPTLFAGTPIPPNAPRPRFRSRAFHPELLRNPTLRSRIHFCLLPLLAFAHIPLQTFFDFNAVYVLLQCVLDLRPICELFV